MAKWELWGLMLRRTGRATVYYFGNETTGGVRQACRAAWSKAERQRDVLHGAKLNFAAPHGVKA